jgi:hypothetical protein
VESQSVLRLSDRLLTTASVSKIRARSEAITIESAQLPQDDFLQYGNVEDLLLFQEASQDREVAAQRCSHQRAQLIAPLQAQALTAALLCSLFVLRLSWWTCPCKLIGTERERRHSQVVILPPALMPLFSLRVRSQPGLRTSR